MPTPQPPTDTTGRWLAHHIIYQGINHGLAVVEILPDGTVAIEPFSAETHSTAFHSGTITVAESPTRLIFS